MLNYLLSRLACLQTLIVASGVLACLLAIPARANLGDELFKLTPADATVHQSFASSVAVSGNTAVIGAPADHDRGDSAGSAYLFDATTGQQLFKLFASDAARNANFGFRVAINGDKAVVSGNGSRAAYVFDVVTGQELFKMIPSETYGIFGYSVGISGNTAIVGAPIESIASSAYLFDVTTGQELFKLTPSDLYVHFGTLFGITVAISGNTAIVGAPFDYEAGSYSGAAYLFDATTGQQLFKLTASDASEGEKFGSSVAINGNIGIIGAPGDAQESGSAYLFDVTTGQELAKLTAPDSAEGDQFGATVAISGTKAFVGAPRNAGAGSSSGAAYLFDVTSHEQLIKLIAADAAEFDYFGESVSISGNYALVGSARAAPFGAAYVFSTVPEPAALALLAVGLLFFMSRREAFTVLGDLRW